MGVKVFGDWRAAQVPLRTSTPLAALSGYEGGWLHPPSHPPSQNGFRWRGTSAWEAGERAVQVSAGLSHSLVLTTGGRALACGDNTYGQLGTGDGQTTTCAAWVDISHAKASRRNGELSGPPRICALSAGALHSVFLSEFGDAFGCGDNEHGQLGKSMGEFASIPRRFS